MIDHTPGPWRFDTKLGVVSEFETNDVGEPMNIAQEVNYLDGPILAAAPNMLDALEAAAHALPLGEEYKQVTEAIAKAKGETG